MAQTHARGGFRYFIPASVALVSAVFISTPGTAQKPESAGPSVRPPVAPVRTTIDEYFGVKVPDPYRYMENLKDPAVANWFKAQKCPLAFLMSAGCLTASTSIKSGWPKRRSRKSRSVMDSTARKGKNQRARLGAASIECSGKTEHLRNICYGHF